MSAAFVATAAETMTRTRVALQPGQCLAGKVQNDACKTRLAQQRLQDEGHVLAGIFASCRSTCPQKVMQRVHYFYQGTL